MFRKLREDDAPGVVIVLDGRPVSVPRGASVAAAVLQQGLIARRTGLSDAPRAPYCLMGVCFDCLMEIDGVPNRRACLVSVEEGMQVRRQSGQRSVTP
jgi:predicted molibdopterin-dependent oxidoreductase YjgC